MSGLPSCGIGSSTAFSSIFILNNVSLASISVPASMSSSDKPLLADMVETISSMAEERILGQRSRAVRKANESRLPLLEIAVQCEPNNIVEEGCLTN